MTHPHIMRFLQLRKEGKIGPVWNHGAGYLLAEEAEMISLAQFTTNYISNDALEDLIDKLSGVEIQKRMPMGREFNIIRRKVRRA